MQDPERARARRLGADYQPHFILVDAQGRIADTWEGRGEDAVWGAMLDKLA